MLSYFLFKTVIERWRFWCFSDCQIVAGKMNKKPTPRPLPKGRDWRLEIGYWKLKIGNWILEIEDWKIMQFVVLLSPKGTNAVLFKLYLMAIFT